MEPSKCPHRFSKAHTVCRADASCQAGQHLPSSLHLSSGLHLASLATAHAVRGMLICDCGLSNSSLALKVVLGPHWVFVRTSYPQVPAVQEAFPDCSSSSVSHSKVHGPAGPPLTLGGGSLRKAGVRARGLSRTPVFKPHHRIMPPLAQPRTRGMQRSLPCTLKRHFPQAAGKAPTHSGGFSNLLRKGPVLSAWDHLGTWT